VSTIVDRAKNICLTPNTEWPIIAAEPTSPGTLVSTYVVPLAAIGAVAGFIGGSIVGHSSIFLGTYRVPLFTGLVVALFSFCMAIVGVFVLSLIINALAPTFGGEQNSTQALKVAVYSYTPAWIAGVLQIIPLLGILAIFGALYGLYLLYLGLPHEVSGRQGGRLHRGGGGVRDHSVDRDLHHRRHDRWRGHAGRRRAERRRGSPRFGRRRSAVRQEQRDG
jgi:hypothetical protein